MKKRTFHVELAPQRGGVFPTAVRCPAGDGHGSFAIPFGPEELQALWLDLGRLVRQSAAPATALPDRGVREAGNRLFQALFWGTVASLYRQTLPPGDRMEDFALILHLNPRDPDFHRLSNLPWEILYDEERSCFVSLRSSVSRYLHIPQPPASRQPELPLRLLIVASSPPDRPPLHLTHEIAEILRASRQATGIAVGVLEDPTFDRLAQQMRSECYNALHFIGHGIFDPETGDGALLFPADPIGSVRIPGKVLTDLLAEARLRLAVLNACDTGRTCDAEGRDPLLGVASALVAQGVPAAVAMQLPISDRAALAFSRAFYQALARGEPTGEAVMRGRLAIRKQQVLSLEWITPVLYLREEEREERGPGRVMRAKRRLVKEEEIQGSKGEAPSPIPARLSLRQGIVCAAALILQALAWTSLIWLATRVPILFHAGTSAGGILVVIVALAVFAAALHLGFLRLGAVVVRYSHPLLAWIVASLAFLAGVTFWFALFAGA